MPKQSWKIQEEVVGLLEKHLSPDARIQVDVKMPVLGSKSGRTRQCDVLVEEGDEPRMTRTLVEVQERDAKPDELTFDGWLKKMRQIGAQHLVCVTESGFPVSIKGKSSGSWAHSATCDTQTT